MNLKIYTIVALIAFMSCMVTQTEALMEDAILEFLEEIRNRMCYPLFGLPALDPLEIEHKEIEINNKYLIE